MLHGANVGTPCRVCQRHSLDAFRGVVGDCVLVPVDVVDNCGVCDELEEEWTWFQTAIFPYFLVLGLFRAITGFCDFIENVLDMLLRYIMCRRRREKPRNVCLVRVPTTLAMHVRGAQHMFDAQPRTNAHMGALQSMRDRSPIETLLFQEVMVPVFNGFSKYGFKLETPPMDDEGMCKAIKSAFGKFFARGQSAPSSTTSDPEVASSPLPVGSVKTETAEGAVLIGRSVEEPAELTMSQIWNKVYHKAEPKAVAKQIAPDLFPTVAHANTIANAQDGIARRLDAKHRVYNPERANILKTRKMVDAIIERVFTKKKIGEWRRRHPEISELKSSKWSGKRFWQAYEDLMGKMQVRIKPELRIKVNEQTPDINKPCRPLVSDGDLGNLCNLLTVSCLEDLLFEHFSKQNIKHKGKDVAMKLVTEYLASVTKGQSTYIEGDGSAWDSTCGPEIRGLIENPVLEHISESLLGDIEVNNIWIEAAMTLRKKNKLNVVAKTWDIDMCGRKLYTPMTILGIRRTGDRGTSVLNYLLNLVLSVCALLDDPVGFVVDPLRKKHNIGGNPIGFGIACEGDDSLMRVGKTFSMDEEQVIVKFWEGFGFNMKLKMLRASNGYIDFVGYHILVKDDIITDVMCPQFARNLRSYAWTSDMTEGSDTAYMALMSRAIAFYGNFVPLGRLFHACARSVARGSKTDSAGHHELSMKLFGEHREKINIEDAVDDAIGKSNYYLKTELYSELVFHAMGMKCEPGELTRLMALEEVHILDTSTVLAALPRAFLPAQ
jgi:hypothetical protein